MLTEATLNTYTGWKKWEPTLDEWEEFQTEQKLPKNICLLENEYLLVYLDKENPFPTCQYIYQEGRLRKIGRETINVRVKAPKIIDEEEDVIENKSSKKIRKTYSTKSKKTNQKTIVPRNAEQICAINMMRDDRSTIKLITGSWGTGKTMLLVTAALEALYDKQFDKIIWLRNNVDVAGTKDLGALPGEVLDKLLPFLGPFIDHCGEENVKSMLKNETLIVEPLQSLRGRNFENAIIMCSEAENLTKEHLQLIIARAADGSEVWLDGDTRQRDKEMFTKSKGIETMIERFKGNELFGYVHLIKSERSKTAAMADLLS